MARKIIITAAVCGSRPTKEMNPAVPYTPKEIIEAAVECRKAGAAIAHIHVRDPKTGKPSFKTELFKEVLDGIRGQCDMIVNLTTSGLFLKGKDIIYRRLEPVYLRPDICSLDVGSMNFSDAAFVNPPQWSEAAAKCMIDQGVKPELEVFDAGHIFQAVSLVEKGLIPEPYFFQICLGVKWGMEATEEGFMFMKNRLPAGAVWSVLGVGKHQLPMIALAMDFGGHVRVGFEDNLGLRGGVLAKSNAELVEVAVDMALGYGREIATPAEARAILGLN